MERPASVTGVERAVTGVEQFEFRWPMTDHRANEFANFTHIPKSLNLRMSNRMSNVYLIN